MPGPWSAFSPEAKGGHKYMHGYSHVIIQACQGCTGVGTNTCTATHTSLFKIARVHRGGHEYTNNHPSLQYSCFPAWKPKVGTYARLITPSYSWYSYFFLEAYVCFHASSLDQRWAHILGYWHSIVSVQYVHWIVLALSPDDILTDRGKTLVLK